MMICLALLALGQTPPEQPAVGPGGSDYTHSRVAVSAHLSNTKRYWLFEPAEPTPDTAPVLLYLHGYGALDPDPYDAMLRHFARHGMTVVYPRYGWWWGASHYEDNAIYALRDALDVLSGAGHVDPELERFAVSGHSLGGILSLRIANRVEAEGLPIPRAIVLHDGAGCGSLAYPHMPLDDLGEIDPQTLLALVIAETAPGDPGAEGVVRRAWENTPQIPRESRNALLVRSHDHGSPALLSNHVAVTTSGRLDAIDWFGYWKPTDAAFSCAFYGTDCEYVLGGGPEVRDMGLWSDDVPAKTIVVAEDVGY